MAKIETDSIKVCSERMFQFPYGLFNIRLRDGESLTGLCTHVEGAMQRVKALFPPAVTGPGGLTSPGYTLEMLDDELSTMAMLHALPCEDYASFISSILLLNGLTKDAVLEAFRTEKTQRRAAEEEAETAATVRAITCYICVTAS